MALSVNRPSVQPQVQSKAVHAAAPKVVQVTAKPAVQAAKPAPASAAKVTVSTGKPAALPPRPQQAAPKPVDQMAKSLAAMKDRWNKAKEESAKDGGRSGTTLSASPKGERHICQLSAARVVQGDKGLSVLLEWTCVEGEEIGEKAVIWLNFDTDEKFIWAQRALRKLEVDVDAIDSPELLPQLCIELVEAAPAARITVKENGEYINCYIDNVVTLEGQDTQVQEGQELPEEATGESSEGAEVATEATDTGEQPNGEGQVEEVVPGLAVGDDVEYTVKGQPQTGVVKQILDDETVNVRNDKTKAVENIDLIKVRKLTET